MCVCEESEESSCWQPKNPGPIHAVRAAAAYFLWKSIPQNAVNSQTSDFGSYCYTQNIENPSIWQ